MQETIKAFEDQAKLEVERRANELINEAVAAMKISASNKSKWLEFAVADFDGTKQILSDLKSTVKLHQVINPVVEGQDSKQPEIKLSPIQMLNKGDNKK